MPDKNHYIEEIRRKVIAKTDLLEGFNADVLLNRTVDLLEELDSYFVNFSYEFRNKHLDLERNIVRYFKSNNFLAVFQLANIYDKETKLKIEDIDVVKDSCKISSDTFERFYNYETTGLDNKTFDFFALFLGYAGWKGFQNEITISDCFFLNETTLEKYNVNESFSEFDVDGFDIECALEQIDENKKNEKENKINIPVLKPKWYRRLFWKIGFRNWVYHFNNDKTLSSKKQEFSPFGFDSITLKQLTKHYISADYKLDTLFSEDESKQKEEDDVLTHLYKRVINNPDHYNITYFFVLAESGIGKTTLLLKLFLKARSEYYGEKKIYILPFAQRHLVYDFSLSKKQNGILLLDAIDEDFSLGKKDDIDVDDFRENTQDFCKIVITSRSQFFRDRKNLVDFVEEAGSIDNKDCQTIALCPFDDDQIIEFFKKKFAGNKEDYDKATRIKDYIGGETMQRQLLIANVDSLFKILDEKTSLKEARGYLLFQCMLENWRIREKNRVKGIVRKAKNSQVLAFEQTMDFCRVLARGFLEMKQSDYFGYSWKELKEKFPKIENFDKTKLLTNRTFLILDSYSRYRFAHSSILDFFLAQIAVEDEAFDKNHFQNSSYIINNKFAKKMYKQGIPASFINAKNSLSRKGLSLDVQYTKTLKDIYQYSLDMRYEPFFFMEKKNNAEKKYKYDKKLEWTPFSEIEKDIKNLEKIKGIKLACNEDNDSWIDENQQIKKERLKKRRYCFNTIRHLLRFFTGLQCLDLSELNLVETELLKINLSKIEVLNLRDNDLKKIPNKPIKLKQLNIIGNKDFELSSLVGIQNISINFSQNLFERLRKEEEVFKNEAYIFLSDKDLEIKERTVDKAYNNRTYAQRIGKKNEINKTLLFFNKKQKNVLFFNQESIIAQSKNRNYFNVDPFELTTNDIHFFFKKKYYRYYKNKSIFIEKDKFFVFSDVKIETINGSFLGINKLCIEITSKSNLTFLNTLLDLENTNFKKQLKCLEIDLDSLSKLKELKKGTLKNCDILKLNCKYNNESNKTFDVSLFESLSGFKHLLIENYSNQGLFSYFTNNGNHIKTITFHHLEFEEFDLSFLELFINIESIEIKTWERIKCLDFRYFSYSRNIKEFYLESEKILHINNERTLLTSKSITNLKLHFSIDRCLKNESNKNDVLEEMCISRNHINLITDSTVYYSKLRRLEIGKSSNSVEVNKALEIDLTFLTRHKRIETLFIDEYSKISNHHLLAESDIKLINLTLKFPDNEDEVVEILDILQSIYNAKISHTHIHFILFSIDEVCAIKVLNKLFESFNQLIEKSTLQLEFQSYLANNRFRFNYHKIEDEQILKLYNSYTNKYLKSDKIYPIFFDLIYELLMKKFNLKDVFMGNEKLNKKNISKRVLNFSEEELTEINDDYFNRTIINLDFKVSRNVFKYGCVVPFKHIRFINTFLDSNLYLNYEGKIDSFIFYFVEKISFSSLQNISLFNFFEQLKHLKEVEILKFYMPKEEFYKIKRYKRIIESLDIKFTVNPNKLEIINADKGLFEIEVID